MKLCIEQLINNLIHAEACTPSQSVSFNGEINQYLFEHFLTPFMVGSCPTVGELDFSQFTLEDVEELRGYLNAAIKTSASLLSFQKKFASANPVTQQQRTFC